jgi:PAS domain S-box-containing protein
MLGTGRHALTISAKAMTTYMHQTAKQNPPVVPLRPPAAPKFAPRFLPALVFAAIGLMLIAGSWQFCHLTTQVIRHEKDMLLSHTASVARSLSHTDFDTLSFTGDDAQRPAYRLLCRKLSAASCHLGLRGLFTLAERDGNYLIGPESYPTNHPRATPPGTGYRLPPAEVALAFSKRLPCVSPLVTDEFGHFITAFVPVLDPYSGKVSFLLAADMDLPVLRRRLMKVSGTSAALTLSIITLLCLLWLLISRRMPLPRAERHYRQYAETFLCALILLLITGSITLHLHVAETQIRSKTLLTAAQQQTALISAEFDAISKSLDGIARVFEASETITEGEFSYFTSHIVRDYSIQAVTWSPAVKRDEADLFEKEVRASGMQTYRIWRSVETKRVAETNQPDAAGRHSDLLYPIRFVNPLAGHENALGFDQMSAPIRREGIRRALAGASPFATRPEPIITLSDRTAGILIYRPVASHTQTGIVALAYCVENALQIPLTRTATSPDTQGLIVELFHLSQNAEPEFLAATDTATPLTAQARSWYPLSGLHTVNASLFAFGNTYGVVVQASPKWMEAHPLRQWATAAIAGVLLTIFITAFLVMMANRRLMLEREVHARTEELQLAHEKIASVISAAPVAMMLVDRETRVLNANPRAERLVHNDILACIDQPCGVFLTCANHKKIANGCGHGIPCKTCVLRNTIQEVAKSGEPVFDRDMALTTERQGREENYYVKFGASPVMLNGQRHVVIAIYDVTAWYRTEQIYRTLFNEMDDGFLLVERSGQVDAPEFSIRAANPALQKLTGRDVASLIGSTLDRSFAVPTALHENIRQVLEDGGTIHDQFFFEGIAKHVSCTAFCPADGQAAIILTDITDQKRAEHALLYERNLLYALMDNQPDRIFFKDAELRFVKVSKEQARALGLDSPAQAIGKTLGELRPGDASRRAMERERSVLKSAKPLMAQVEKSVNASGRTCWDSISIAPIHDASGECVGLVGIARDITPEIELQQHLQHMTKMDAIGRLAGGVAHDFNNLLQAILGYTELLLAGMTEKSPQYGDLKEIERAAKRAADLTRQLLTFSRKQHIEPQIIDMNQAILSVEKMLKRLMGDQILIQLDLQQALESVMIDPSQMEQILLNLAINAKDAMANGGTLSFRTEMVMLDEEAASSQLEAHPGTFVKLTVSDTGSGIPEDAIPYVFDPFFTTKERGKGTGLGLSVIYGIVKQCGGWISVSSSADDGTHFSLYFSAHEATDVVTTEETRPVVDMPVTLPGIGKTILLVEDEPGVRNLAALVMQSAGYKVHTCVGASEAKAVFAKEYARIDLLFSDIALIGQNGIDLALDLRKQNPALPCLLCSGYVDETMSWDSLQKEGFHFLPKPYPVAKLLTAVAEALAGKFKLRI